MNILDLLKSLNVETADASHHHVQSGWIGVDCPYCSPRSYKFRLGFEIKTGRSNCWNCGLVKGFDVLKKLGANPNDLSGMWDKLFSKSIKQRATKSNHTGFLKNPSNVGPLLEMHRRYLIDRKCDPDQLSTVWNIGGLGITGNLKYRVFIPIFDRFGNQISWTSRTLATDDSVLRYISAPLEHETTPHKHVLYGSHLARHTIVIVEGPTDA